MATYLNLSAPDGVTDVKINDIPFHVTAGTLFLESGVAAGVLRILRLLGFKVVGVVSSTSEPVVSTLYWGATEW